jgi:hypothetical protein
MGLILPSAALAARQTNLAATPTTALGALVTAHATIHTKGSYAELIASTTHDAVGFWLLAHATQVTATATPLLLDIAIGAAASEVVIVPDLQAGWKWSMASSVLSSVYLPVRIPKGSRIAARCQALITADTVRVIVALDEGPANGAFPGFAGCDVYGLDAANSRGTLHTPGATGTEATTNIGSTTSRAYSAVGIEVGGGALTVMNLRMYHFELSDGTNAFAEWAVLTDGSEAVAVPFPSVPFFCSIPFGVQLVVSGESSGTADELDVAFRCYY